MEIDYRDIEILSLLELLQDLLEDAKVKTVPIHIKQEGFIIVNVGFPHLGRRCVPAGIVLDNGKRKAKQLNAEEIPIDEIVKIVYSKLNKSDKSFELAYQEKCAHWTHIALLPDE